MTSEELIKKLDIIVRKGYSAEVKRNKDGGWVVYEVRKKKMEVE